MRLAIVTLPIAAYRLEWSHHLAASLGSGWKAKLFYGEQSAKDHAWTNLFSGDASYEAEYCPAMQAPAAAIKALRKFKLIRGTLSLPSHNLMKALVEFNPTVLLITEYNSYTIPALVWAHLTGIPVIVETEMGSAMTETALSKFSRWKHQLCARWVKGQVSNTKAAMAVFSDSVKHALLAPHAVDSTLYVPIPHEPEKLPVILFVGNLIERKGVDLLLQAIATVKTSFGEAFRVRLLGGGEIAWAKRIAEENGVSALVDFVAFKEGRDLIAEYQSADIFVLPSRFDTYGVVSHEAACCGLPLVISKFAGSSEVLVDEGVNGFVVDPFGTERFAEVLCTLLGSSSLRAAMGMASREKAKAWCVRQCGERSAELVRQLWRGNQ